MDDPIWKSIKMNFHFDFVFGLSRFSRSLDKWIFRLFEWIDKFWIDSIIAV